MCLRVLLKKTGLFLKKDFLENIIWVLTIGIGLAYLFSIAGELIVNLVAPQSGEAANQTLVETLVQSNFLLMFFQSVIIAPFIEELLFRGLIFNSLRQNMVWAHLISAFLFGLLHVYSYILAGDMSEWIKLIPYMMAGLSFSIVYEKRQTIIAPIILHAAKKSNRSIVNGDDVLNTMHDIVFFIVKQKPRAMRVVTIKL